MSESSEVYRKILQLDERRAGNTIAHAVGKWGAGWVLECIAEVFDEFEDNGSPSKGAAETRAKLLRGLANSVFAEKKS